ncbi:MAG: hypothetical protein M0Z94_15975 [Dehalococcoidales bacterium]|nr:hypothetical protein [Dehalococcoidales bacterium]
MELAPATITNLNTLETVYCRFRPKQYTFTKQNRWTTRDTKGGNVPDLEFGGGGSMTMRLELIFDTYEDKGPKDVRLQTNSLWRMMLISPLKIDPRTQKGEPPMCEFRWGAMWSFQAVIMNLEQTFTMFLPDGTPVRASVRVTFQQAAEVGRFPGQNPTSGGVAGQRVHLVSEGETIDNIAFQEYGDAKHWRYLADANRLEDVRRLRSGQTLVVPPLR